MKNSNFTYYMHDGPTAFSFEMAGALSADDAAELDHAWRTASAIIGDRALVVDLSFVTRIDDAGRNLLRAWHENGATLVANSPTSLSLAESIIGAPLPAAASAPTPTYGPFWTQLTRRAAVLFTVILLTLLHPVTAAASAMPGSWQVPEHGQELFGTYKTIVLRSPFTPAISEKRPSGL